MLISLYLYNKLFLTSYAKIVVVLKNSFEEAFLGTLDNLIEKIAFFGARSPPTLFLLAQKAPLEKF